MVWLLAFIVGIFLFLAFPRVVGTIGLLVVAGAVILFGSMYFSERADEAKKNSVQVTLTWNHERCANGELPLHVSISNKTNEYVHNISFSMMAHRAGYSSEDDFCSYSRNCRFSSNKIIAPGYTYGWWTNFSEARSLAEKFGCSEVRAYARGKSITFSREREPK
ncbi:MAG: hypothetical protein AAGA72_18610 [Pseudomonadota bacterium]